MKPPPIPAISLLTLLLILTGVCLFAGCTQKVLEMGGEETAIQVIFDWQDAPQAHPEGMTLLFFPADMRSQAWRFDIAGRDGGPVELLSGIYNVLAFNNDLPGVDFTDTDSFDRFSATPRSISDTLTAPTGMLYAAALSRVAVFPHEGNITAIRLQPDSISTLYHLRLDSVSGTQRLKTATAILHGPARSVRLSDRHNSADSCAMSTALRIADGHPDRLEAEAAAFGLPDCTDPRFFLDVIVTTSHGKYSKTFDVTPQVVNSKYPKNVYINIKGLVIPEADTPGGSGDGVGISVGVDGWSVIEINYS